MTTNDYRYVLAIVGNGECAPGSARRIDAATRVVRFGHAAGLGHYSGERVDDLIVSNRGSCAARLLEDSKVCERPAFAAASRVVLPFDPQSIFLGRPRMPHAVGGVLDLEGRDYSEELRSRLRCSSRPVTCIDASVHEECCRQLGLTKGPCNSRSGDPSIDSHWRPCSALVALFWYAQGLTRCWRIELHGFDLELRSAGWIHPERAWINQIARGGRVQIIESYQDLAA